MARPRPSVHRDIGFAIARGVVVIPLIHDLAGTRVLVFGGGTVGARKARRFAREARVVVISPTFGDRDFGTATLIRAEPGPDDVPGWIDRVDPAVVVAATDDGTVNAAAERAALQRGTLVNRTDGAGAQKPGSVIVPATVRDDPVIVAVTTSGHSPSVSRELRDRIEEAVAGAGAVAAATGAIRRTLQARSVPEARRRAAIRAATQSDRVWQTAQEGGDVAAVAWTVVAAEVGETPADDDAT